MRNVIAAALSLMVVRGVCAQVVPSSYHDTSGDSSFVGPLSSQARTYQLLMHEDLLTDLVGDTITGISFRLPSVAAASWPATDVEVGNYWVYLSEGVAPADRSNVFSENVVGTQTRVRSGDLDIAANSYTFGGDPNEFGPAINVTDWVYHGGHLLVEIQHVGFFGTARSTDALTTLSPGYGTMYSALSASSFAATDGVQASFSIIKFTAINTPAPGVMTMLFGGMAITPRRRRR